MLTGGLALRALVLVAAVRSEIVSKWFACDANCPPLNATARAAARCGGAPRPRVAVCLAGHARTFMSPMVHTSLKPNLLEAFGGEYTVFADLKLGATNWGSFGTTGYFATEAADRAALLRILGGLGVPGNRTRLNAGEVDVGGCDSGAWDENLTAAERRSRFPAEGARNITFERAYFDSLAGQMASRLDCHTMIANEEAATGQNFDSVLFSRADVAWPQPVRPFCAWDLEGAAHVKWDHILLMPRSYADAMLRDVPRQLATCARPFVPGDTIERWYFRGVRDADVGRIDGGNTDLTGTVVRACAHSPRACMLMHLGPDKNPLPDWPQATCPHQR